jgi:outer membrane protein assembly factor BamB
MKAFYNLVTIGFSITLAGTLLAQASPTDSTISTSDAAKKPAPATVKSDVDSKSWSVFRGNRQSTGVAVCELPAELEVLWKYEVPKGAFEGTATIVADPKDPAKQIVYVGDLDGKLFAFDLATGEKKWEFTTEIGFMTAPAVREGLIYIGDIDGIFYCIDQEGKKVWSVQLDGEIDSSANFHGDNVLVGSQDARLYAFNAKTGEPAWRYEAQDQIRCSITGAEDRAFVAGCDGFFHVVDLTNGKEAGNTDIGNPTGSTPAMLGDMVYFGTEGGSFFASDWKKIENVWEFEDEVGGRTIRGCAAVNKDHVVFGASNRQVYSLNPKTGKQNWTVKLKAKIDSSPVIVGDRVFVASTDGRFYALKLKDGSITWEKQFNGGFISSPAVAFERLVIASDRGVVYCLGSK